MLLGPVMILSCGWEMTRLLIILSHEWRMIIDVTFRKNGMIKNKKFTYLEKVISCISYKYPRSLEKCVTLEDPL